MLLNDKLPYMYNKVLRYKGLNVYSFILYISLCSVIVLAANETENSTTTSPERPMTLLPTTTTDMSVFGNDSNLTSTVAQVEPDTCPPKDPLYCIWKVWWPIQRIYYYVCESLGVPANILVIAVMVYRRVEYACHWYVVVVAFADLLFCIAEIMTNVYLFLPEGFMNVWLCRVVFDLYSFSRAMSSWTMVVISLERLLIIVYPFKARRISRRGVGLIVTAVLVFILGAFLFPKNFYVYYQYKLDPGFGMVHECTIHPDMYDSFMVYAMVETFFTVYVTPVVLNFIVNALICISLVAVAKKRGNLQGPGASQSEDSSAKSPAEKKLTRMLILVSFMHTICTLPTAGILAAVQLNVFTTEHEIFLYRLLLYSFSILSEFNNFNNFFVYMVANQAFRKAFLKMFGCGGSDSKLKYSATTKVSMSMSTRNTEN